MTSFYPTGSNARPWFRIGRYEVGTTMLVVLAVIASWVVGVFVQLGTGNHLVNLLAHSPQLTFRGEVWRPFTWPLANQVDIWGALTLFFFWIFATEIENQLGREGMAKLLVGIWAIMTIICTALGLSLNQLTFLAGIGMVEFVILLLWIAEYPQRPFFFSIPAWLVGSALVAIQILQMIGYGDVIGIATMLLTFCFVAILARRLGLLVSYDWIPGRPSGPKPSKQQRQAAKAHEQRAKDAARLDELLDIIAEKGMDGLSPAQRRELMRLRNRR